MTIEYLDLASFKEKVFNFDENKDWKFEGDKPALIDFYADWCGPCKTLSPILEQLAEEYKDKVSIYKIDTEKQQELAAMFGIRSIPSILFVPKDGKPQMAAGLLPKDTIKKAFEEIFSITAE